MRALLLGSPGRAPFAGHFRGAWRGAGVELWYAGRIRAAAGPEDAWNAAEAVRDALAGLSGDTRYAVIDAAWTALRSLGSEDLSVLFVARDGDGVVLAASGLSEVRGDGKPVAPEGHPLFDEPGIRDRPGFYHPDRVADDWVAVPTGSRWSNDPVDAACGARTP